MNSANDFDLPPSYIKNPFSSEDEGGGGGGRGRSGMGAALFGSLFGGGRGGGEDSDE